MAAVPVPAIVMTMMATIQDIQAATTSLSDHLIWQLGLTQLPDRDRMLVRVLIEALDEDGYLSQTLDELAEIMPEEMEIEPEELQIALKHLQHFDRPASGAQRARVPGAAAGNPAGRCRYATWR